MQVPGLSMHMQDQYASLGLRSSLLPQSLVSAHSGLQQHPAQAQGLDGLRGVDPQLLAQAGRSAQLPMLPLQVGLGRQTWLPASPVQHHNACHRHCEQGKARELGLYAAVHSCRPLQTPRAWAETAQLHDQGVLVSVCCDCRGVTAIASEEGSPAVQHSEPMPDAAAHSCRPHGHIVVLGEQGPPAQLAPGSPSGCPCGAPIPVNVPQSWLAGWLARSNQI